jgi:hypothetical protein
MNKKLIDILKEELNQSNNKEEFWKMFFDFVKLILKERFEYLSDKGIPETLLASVSKGELKEKSTDRIEKLQETMVALTEICSVFEGVERKIDNLEKKLNDKKEKLNKKEKKLSDKNKEIEKIKTEVNKEIKEYENENKLKSKKIKSKLKNNFSIIREYIMMINGRIDDLQEDELDQEQIKNIVIKIADKLEDFDLWPNEEEKPSYTNKQPKNNAKNDDANLFNIGENKKVKNEKKDNIERENQKQ